MMTKRRRTLLLMVCIAAIIAGCSRSSVPNDRDTAKRSGLMVERVLPRPQMPSKPPIPLEQLESKIETACSIELDQWRRTYFYKWQPDLQRFSTEELSFSFDRGPYPDLRPSHSWRDIREVAAIDDRPGIEIILGHYSLKSGSLDFEMGPCSHR